MRLCRNKKTQVERAVKILRKDAMTDKMIEFFLNEIEILTKIDHPNIVRLYEVYEDSKKFYLVQE